MTVPKYEECMLTFLNELADGQPHQTKDIVIRISLAIPPQQ
jgi:hypothetical protein